MTTAVLKAFRRSLENRQTELGRGRRNREALAIETSPDQSDRIQNASERDYAMSNLERDSNGLREVRIALRSIDAGSFGICVSCEENISPKRLAAVPWASSCIVCQLAADGRKTPEGEIRTSLAMAV